MKLFNFLAGTCWLLGLTNGIAAAIENGHKDINASNKYGATELHKVILLGDKKRFDALLATDGIDVNVQDKDGRTPLHYAYFVLSWYFIIELIKAGANESLMDKEGVKPFKNNDLGDVLIMLKIPCLCKKQRDRAAYEIIRLPYDFWRP